MNSKKIVITGGPATGKTTVIKGLQALKYSCFNEYIRELTTEAKDSGSLNSLETNPIDAVANPLEFNKKLLEGRTNQFLKSQRLDEALIFFDRGIPDVLAYMQYFKQNLEPKFIEAAKRYQYDIVFLLPMWKKIFTTDEERFESFDAGVKIQDCLKKTYANFRYNVIEVPCDTVKNRIDFILNTAKK